VCRDCAITFVWLLTGKMDRIKKCPAAGCLSCTLPHILCLTEHHKKQLELEQLHIENYNLSARYCRRTLEKGGVSIFVHEDLKFTKVT
jgi:hypothetical protein